MRRSSGRTWLWRARKCSYKLFERFRAASFLSVLGCLAILFAFLARTYVQRYSIPRAGAAGIYLCFLVLVALALAPGFRSSSESAAPERPKPQHLVLLGCGCLLPYLLYALGTGDFHWLALLKLAVVAVVTIGVYAVARVRNHSEFLWQDVLVAVFLIAVVLSGWLKRIWNVPVNLDFMGRLFVIAVASWAWSWVRPLPALGYKLQITGPVLKEAALQFALFAALGVPLSLLLGFTTWHPRWVGLQPFLASYLEIFLFIALLEELFFRGFLQTILTGSFGSWWKAQLFVSILFGLFHILHAPFPNWRYVALATLAGWFYGSAFRKTGSITASALVHATVDTVWRTWLTR